MQDSTGRVTAAPVVCSDLGTLSGHAITCWLGHPAFATPAWAAGGSILVMALAMLSAAIKVDEQRKAHAMHWNAACAWACKRSAAIAAFLLRRPSLRLELVLPALASPKASAAVCVLTGVAIFLSLYTCWCVLEGMVGGGCLPFSRPAMGSLPSALDILLAGTLLATLALQVFILIWCLSNAANPPL